MPKRFLSLFLTLVTLLAAAPIRVRAAGEMTDEDESEARALAVTFMRRLRETDDFAPLVSEFFPEDFEQRVKQFVRDAARLRSFVEKLERCVALMREGVSKLRSDAESLAAAHCLNQDAVGEDGFKVYHVDDQHLEAPYAVECG